jgi:cell pole-organizing protein PopZ
MSQSDIEAVLADAAPQSAAAEEADILDLTESMTAQMEEPPPASAAAPAAFRTIDAHSDVVFTDTPTPAREPAPIMPAVVMEEPEQRSPPAFQEFDRALMSASTSAAVDAAFSTLAHTVLVQNARTLEDLVKEMLRPMLKSWLDNNLPGLVERIVRAEIERVSRGRA